MIFNSVKIYQILFALSILSISYSKQFIYGARISEFFILTATVIAIFFIKIDVRNFKLLLVGFSVLAISLFNDGFYFLLNDFDERRVLLRVVLYEKYMLFFTIPIFFSIIQRKNYDYDYKYLLSKTLLILYLLIVPLLLYQSLVSRLPRLSFPFSSDFVMIRSDAHALSVTMAFLLVNTYIFLEGKSILLRLLVITPGLLALILTGSRGGVLLLIVFCLLYFKSRWYIFISLLLLIFISLTSSINIEIYGSGAISRVFDIERMIRENVTSDNLNRWSMNANILSELLENFRIFTGMGIIGMRYFYYDALLPSLLAPFGMLGFLMVFYFLFSLYRMNIPNNLNNKRIYKIFSIMFLISIGISEYHLVARVYVVMMACIYCFTDTVNYKKKYYN
jgi:hypothetical protein